MSLPSPPVATADTAEAAENTAVSINVLANDSSPNGTLTLTGVTQGAHGTVAIAQVTNSAVSISSGQEINAGAVLAYDRNQPFTVMAQFDVAQNPAEVAVIASNLVGSGSAHPGYQVFIDPAGHLQVRLVSNYSTGNDIDVQSSFVVTNGNWHDIAVSYDGSGSASGIKIYEDGKQDTAATVIANSLTGSIVSSTPAPLIIGNQAGYESSYDLHGSLEQLSISDVVRSAAYIAQYSLSGSVAPVDANTALDYNFNQNTGTIAHDLSSNGYNGTLSGSAMWTGGPSVPEVTYTPLTGFVGTDTFSYTESNGTGTATGQVTVTVNPPPVATADTAEAAENTAVSINVLANDSSPNGTLTLTGVTQGAHGTVAIAQVTNSAVSISSGQEINAGAVLAYDRNQPFTVMAQFDVAQNPAEVAVIASNLVGSGSAHPGYQVFIDPAGHLQVRLVSNYSTGNDIDVQSSFVVTNGNWHDIAVSYDGSGSASGIKIYEDGKQDMAATVIANSLTGSIVSSTPAPLIIGNQAGYESSYDLHGSLEQLSISDVVRSAAYIAQYSLSGSVAPVDANTALDYNFNQNTGTIAHDLSSNGYNGTLSGSAMWTGGPSVPEVTYTPLTGFVGTDTFSYTESNGTGTATGQVTVTVNPPPVATADTAEAAENTAVSINVLANDSSPNGTLTLTGVTQGAHGTVAIAQVTNSAVSISSGQEINAGAVLAYDRNQPFTVMAQFDVAQNPAEVAVIASNLVGSGSAHPGYQVFIDPAGHLQVRLVSNYSTGNDIDVQSSFVVTNGNWHDIAVSYDGSGSASGIKIYEDGKQDMAATVIANSLTGSIVSSTPAPLIIGNQAGYESSYDLHGSLEQLSISDVVRSAAYIAQYSLSGSVAPVDANTALDYNFNQNTGTIAHDLSSNGYNGTLSGSAMWTGGPSVPEVTYTPLTGFVGTDTFSYTESNGTGTASGQVTVTVNPSPPVATADTAETAENTAVSINVLANDSSPNGTLTLTGVTQGAHGTVAIAQVTNSALDISSGQEINAGSVLAYDRSQPFTVMAQFDVAQNPNAFGGTAEDAAVIFTNVNASPYPGYELWIDSTGHLRVRIISNFITGNYIDVESSIVVTDGKWHDVAYSYDGSSSASGVKIYVDGHQDMHTTTLVNSLTGSIVSPTHGPLIIGNQTGWPYALDGLLEQFSISDVVRSAAYVAEYSLPGSVAPVDANTALDYNFNQNTGTIAHDLSSNGYNGTLSSSAMWTSGPSVPEVTYTPKTGFVGTDTFSYTESNGTGTATGQVTVNVGSGVSSSLASPALDTTAQAFTDGLGSDTGPSSTDKITANTTSTGSADPNPTVTTVNGQQIDATTPVAMPDRAHVASGASIEVTHAEASTSGVLVNDMDSAPSSTLSINAVQGQAGNVGHAVEGAYGSLTLNADGSYTYANTNPAAVTAAGGAAQDVFTYMAGNGHGGTTTSTLTFVITSPGDTYVGGASGVTIQGGIGSYVLDGGGGHDTVIAGTGTQVLIGGPGDTFLAGKGADTFVFAAHFGNQTINNFNPEQDVIALPHAEIASFAAILADTHLEGQNTVITLNANDMITLNHVSPHSLHASDFHLV